MTDPASPDLSSPSGTPTPPGPSASTTRQLRRALTHRHIHFIALGSAIGTGLFYGSSGAIGAAGPGVVFVYLLGGAVVYFMLRALGEMSVAEPVAGSFAEHCRRFLGGWAGYITGWMYAFEMIIVCLADLTAVALYMKFWFPDTASWVWVAVALIIVAAANLASTRWYGELEFWFTLVKVTAVVAMIVGGAAILVFNVDTGGSAGIDNLWNDGGMFPNGATGVLSSLILVLFAFGGTEVIGVTAGEAKDYRTAIPKAINTVPVRILLFYVLAILVIVSVTPWREITGEESPFVQIFSTLGVSWAAGLLNVVVLTAALSAINSDLYGAGRIIFGMAREHLAPSVFAKLSRNGVPVTTVGAMLCVLVIGVAPPALERDRRGSLRVHRRAGDLRHRLRLADDPAGPPRQPLRLGWRGEGRPGIAVVPGAVLALGTVSRDRRHPRHLRHDVLARGVPLGAARRCHLHGRHEPALSPLPAPYTVDRPGPHGAAGGSGDPVNPVNRHATRTPCGV
ncbi:Proline-specific permease ProY OS=Corynebacterium variabile OX=1727 GN=proY PE=3 SV=1 [Corynebacterium variabile]